MPEIADDPPPPDRRVSEEKSSKLTDLDNSEQRSEKRSSSRLLALSKHPLVVTFFGFVLTGILGGTLTWWLNNRDHLHDRETSLRDSAILAVTDISDLVNERRARANFVYAAIKRKAPEAEVSARKIAYDEAALRWNVKLPGDTLRLRGGLHWSCRRIRKDTKWPRSRYEFYIDSLILANRLDQLEDEEECSRISKDETPTPQTDGLFRIMDQCLTAAFDAYREASFKDNGKSMEVFRGCNFEEIQGKSVFCFANIAEALYKAANAIGEPIDLALRREEAASENELIKLNCTPPLHRHGPSRSD